MPPAPPPRPAAARHAGRPKQSLPGSPPLWLRAAASAALGLLAGLLILSAILTVVKDRTRKSLEGLPRLHLQAEMIREAYAELAETGGLLKKRLANSDAKPGDVKKHVYAAARTAGIKVKVGEPKKIDSPKGLTVYSMKVTGTGREIRVLDFLAAIDGLPAVVKIDRADLDGVASGTVSMEVSIHHMRFSAGLARRLKNFVDKLPTETPPKRPRIVMRRSGDLFVPSEVSDMEAVANWPNVTLKGFTADKALFGVDGESVSVALGAVVTGDIIYADKLAVNQALLKRQSDGAEIILTVGSPTFALKPRKSRGMSEFVLTLQKRASSDLLTAADER